MNISKPYAERIEAYLTAHLPSQSHLTDAMRYATLNGGKRLRAALLYASGELFSIPLSQLDNAAAAIECIHAYSLIHDDLPAMDNDDMRRGKPSCHKAFGEAEAILAGDALNTIAFEFLAHSPLAAEVKIAQILCLAQTAGHAGMIGGQSLDIAHTNQQINYKTLQSIHHQKTGALITAALHLGALPEENYSDYQTTLQHIGEKLGIAYQILDDILDETADSNTLGKTAGKDKAQGKNTYVHLLGIEKSQMIVENLRAEIHEHIQNLPAGNLHLLIEEIFGRNY